MEKIDAFNEKLDLKFKHILLFVVLLFFGFSSNTLHAQDTDGDGISDVDEGLCADGSLVWLDQFPTARRNYGNNDLGEDEFGDDIEEDENDKTQIFGFTNHEVAPGLEVSFVIDDSFGNGVLSTDSSDRAGHLSDSGVDWEGDQGSDEPEEEGLEQLINWGGSALYDTDPNQKVTFTFTFSEPVILFGMDLKDIDIRDHVDGLKIQGFNGATEVPMTITYDDPASISTYNDPHNPGDTFYYATRGSSQNDGTADREDMDHWIRSNSGGNKITQLVITATSIDGDWDNSFPNDPTRFVISTLDLCYDLNTDGDAFPDYLDLDSDADNCWDAIEGDGTYTLADVDSNGVITTTPVTVQGIGESREAFSGVLASIDTQPADDTVCSGDDAVFTVVTSGDALVYQWQEQIGGAGAWSDLTDTGIYTGTDTAILTLTAPPEGAAGNKYHLLISSTAYQCTDLTSAEAELAFIPGSEAGIASAFPDVICPNETSEITLAMPIVGTIQWQNSTDSGVTFNDITGATSATYTTPPLTATTSYQAVVTNGGCTAAISNEVIVGMNSTAPVGTVSASPIAVCPGETSEITLTGHSGGVQWQSSTDGGLTYTDITGETSMTYTTEALTVETRYQAILTGCGVTGTSSSALVTINAPSIGGMTVASPDDICPGDNSVLSLDAASFDVIQWQSSTDDGLTYNDISGATSPTYTTPALTAAVYYRAIVTNGTCSSDISEPIEVTVGDVSQGGRAVASSIRVCHGGDSTLSLEDDLGSIFQWQSDGGIGAWADISGATSATYLATGITNATSYRAIVTNCGTVDTSDPVTVAVDQLSVAGPVSSDTAICEGTNTTVALTGTVVGVIQWQSSEDSGVTYNDIMGATSATYTTTGGILTTTMYQAVVTNGACSSDTSSPITITVDLPSFAGPISASSEIICLGETSTMSLTGTVVGDIQWQVNDGSGFIDISGATTASYTPVAITTLPITYQAVVTNGSCSPDYADIIIQQSSVDSDGDGVLDCTELAPILGTVITDPNDPCDYNIDDRTLPVSGDFLAADCDNDGNPNGTDPNPDVATAVDDMDFDGTGYNALFYTSTDIDILDNDDFLPQVNNTITQIGGTATGTVLFNESTGELTYTPLRSESGTTVTVDYEVCYFNGTISTCAEATVTIDVSSDDLDLSVEKTVSNNRPEVDSETTFYIEVTNHENNFSATNVVVTDILPSGYQFVSSQASQGSYTNFDGIWGIGEIAKGASVTLSITAIVNENGDHLNCATITDLAETDTDNSNDESCIEVTPFKEIEVPEAFSPNGDGMNELFVINNLVEFYPNFRMEVMNRWGNMVYGYTHNGDVNKEPEWWDGISDAQINLSSEVLPAGTYFYAIYFNDWERRREPETGWIYLRK